MKKRECNKCKIKLPLSDYHKSKYNNDGKDKTCKHCRNAYKRKLNKNGISWLKRNREYARDSYYKHTYGITLKQYDRMFEQQNGVCEICGGINTDGRRLAVDHNHKTNEVRGLLCLKCNGQLSGIEDRSYLKKAIKYLRKYNEFQRMEI